MTDFLSSAGMHFKELFVEGKSLVSPELGISTEDGFTFILKIELSLFSADFIFEALI